MAYRRTERVVRRLAARHDAILAAARSVAAEGGMAAMQIAPVAERAGIAAGTVYRYFPSKTDLVHDLVAHLAAQEANAMREAAAAAPGPLSAIAYAVAAFGQRALEHRRLTWALMAESLDSETDEVRLGPRRELAAELERLIRAAAAAGLLAAEPDFGAVAPALIGALVEGLVGPLAPDVGDSPARRRETVQAMTLLILRALGVADARARGLVVQMTLPSVSEGAA